MATPSANFQPSRVRTAADVYALVSDAVLPQSGEARRLIHLDGEGRVLGVSAAGAMPTVRQALREAVALGSAAVVMAHLCGTPNPHPAGSQLDACAELVEAARSLSIKVLDYLLFGTEEFHSFRALGLL
jgi:DNA repair protein RadC